MDLSKIPTQTLIDELEKRKDYCYYRGGAYSVKGTDEIVHLCHEPNCKVSYCEKAIANKGCTRPAGVA